jgi:hypothetical protein
VALVRVSQSIDDVGSAIGEVGQPLLERLEMLFRLLPALQRRVETFDLIVNFCDCSLQRA